MEMKKDRLPELYEQYVEGIITKEQFILERGDVEVEVNKLINQKEDYIEIINKKLQYSQQYKSVQDKYESIDSHVKISSDIVKKYIEKIIVFRKDNFEIAV